MNKRNQVLVLFWIVLIFFACSKSSLAVEKKASLHSFDKKTKLPRIWNFHSGDNSSWADTALDISQWDTMTTFNFMPEKLNNIGWFRIKLHFDSSYLNRIPGLLFSQDGAMEVFWDGKKIGAFGIIGKSDSESIYSDPKESPIPIYINDLAWHTLAVRYANYSAFERNEKHVADNQGFVVALADANSAFSEQRNQDIATSSIFMVIAGLMLGISFLHFLLFIFYKEQKSNLYYSIFAFLLSFSFYYLFFIKVGSSIDIRNFLNSAFSKIWPLIFLSLIALLHCIFYNNIRKTFLIPVSFYIFILISDWLSEWETIANIIFLNVAIFEIIRLIYVSFSRKRAGKVVGIGALIFVGIITVLSLCMAGMYFMGKQDINVDGDNPLLGFIILSAIGLIIFSLPIAMSIYLAKSFSSINKDLNLKLKEVQELSRKTIEQEHEKQQLLTDQNSKLEEEVKKRTAELSNKNSELEEKSIALTKAMDTLKNTQGQLVHSEKMASLGLLTAGIAHEINNPINFMASSISPLKRDISDILEVVERFRKLNVNENPGAGLALIEKHINQMELNDVVAEIGSLLNNIQEGAERTSEIVRGLRNFSRLDENDFKSVNLHEGLESTLALLHGMMGNRIQLLKKYGNITDIDCYPSQVNQVFMNILTNAIQSINGEGTITVETQQLKREICISIKDTGKGMDPGTLGKIFDPFFTTKDYGSGSGLGLSISYGIMQKHKGRIEVESEEGRGSEFRLYFPAPEDKLSLDEE